MSESIGKPQYFCPDVFASVVESLICSDEVERALHMLEKCAPAWYRQYPTPRMLEIKESLHRQLFTPSQYAMADRDAHNLDVNTIAQYWPGRAQVLGNKIRDLNEQGVRPNIMEIGPGSFWLPYSLRLKKLDFTYEYQSLTQWEMSPLPFDKPTKADGVNVFVGYELIEHLSNEWEIYQAYLKFNKKAEYVFLSTPLFTHSAVSPNWRENALGHLRAYCPSEFLDVAKGMFTGRNWEMYSDDTIVLCGKLI